MAFQVADDLLDYTEQQEITGKPSGHDLKERKVTLPLIAALREMPATARARVERLFTMPEPDDEAIAEVLAIVQEHGGIATPFATAQDTIEALERYGLFSRFLPEWRAVRSLPQRNAFHTFTVDHHLLQTIANAGEFVRDVARPDLLLVGALLHDIGKGFPGDHTVVGMEIVRRIGARMGFPQDDVDVLVRLVRDHLLLPETATRRDLADPASSARLVEAALALRPLSDLDLLVHPRDIAAVGELLRSMEYEQTDSSPSYVDDEWLDLDSRDYCYFASRQGFDAFIEYRVAPLELAVARLTDLDAGYTQALRAHAQLVWTRGRFDVSGGWVRQSPEDLLLHVATHLAAKHRREAVRRDV